MCVSQCVCGNQRTAVGVGSLLALCGFQGLNWGHQACMASLFTHWTILLALVDCCIIFFPSSYGFLVNYFFLCVCVCVCMCLCVCTFVHVHVCVCTCSMLGDQRLTLDIFLSLFPLYIWDLGLADWLYRLASKPQRSSCLCPPPTVRAGVIGACHCVLLFIWVLGIQIQIFILV